MTNRRNRQSNAAVLENIVLDETASIKEVPDTTLDEYEKLNAKCDVVISKIKDRKKKKSKPQTV
jgi:hypothetical protein